MLKLARDSEGQLVQPEVRTQNDVESPDKTTIIGQFNGKDQLHGVGRIALTGGEYDCYQEGQFENHVLNGFGRELRFDKEGKQTAYVGWFKNGKYHGYGKKFDNMTRMKEGVWNEHNQEQPYTMNFDEIIQNPDPTKEPIDFATDQKPYLSNSEGNCIKPYTWTFKEIEQWSNAETRPEQFSDPLKEDYSH